MLEIDPHIFEIAMLFCFGSSWPFAIAKTIRTKVVKGKSIVFIMLVVIGYSAGIISKLVGEFDHVIWLYALNGSMVFTEMILYFRYHHSNDGCVARIVTPKWQMPDYSGNNCGLSEPIIETTNA